MNYIIVLGIIVIIALKQVNAKKEVMVMANTKNLKVPTSEEARKNGKKGGIASGKARAERKALKEELLLLLSEGNTQKKISLSLIKEAIKGNTKAFEVIRDTIGEKPVEKVDMNANISYEEAIKEVADNSEY